MGEGHGPGGGDGVLRGWCEKHVPASLHLLLPFFRLSEPLKLAAQRGSFCDPASSDLSSLSFASRRTRSNISTLNATPTPPSPLVSLRTPHQLRRVERSPSSSRRPRSRLERTQRPTSRRLLSSRPRSSETSPNMWARCRGGKKKSSSSLSGGTGV